MGHVLTLCLFYADQFDGERMKGLTIVDRSKKGESNCGSRFSHVEFSQNTWDFSMAPFYLVAPDSTYRNILRFEHQQLQLPRTPGSRKRAGLR